MLPGAPWVPLTCGALHAGFVHCVVRIHFFWDTTVQLVAQEKLLPAPLKVKWAAQPLAVTVLPAPSSRSQLRESGKSKCECLLCAEVQ